MSYSTLAEHIKACAKPHRCDWCGEKIEIRRPYFRWRWYDNNDASTVRVHPECHAALGECDPYDMQDGFSPYDNPRGCNCGHDLHCERCNQRKLEKEVTA